MSIECDESSLVTKVGNFKVEQTKDKLSISINNSNDLKYEEDGDTFVIKTADGVIIARFGPNGSVLSADSANSPDGRKKQYDDWFSESVKKAVTKIHAIADK